jgi:hypothetical protein
MSKFTRETYSSVRGNGERGSESRTRTSSTSNQVTARVTPWSRPLVTFSSTSETAWTIRATRCWSFSNETTGTANTTQVYTSPSARDYETDVATFFANLMLGLEVEEPEVLAFRRPKDEQP